MAANKYKHLFFDLDRTLWDFDTNNKLTFAELFDKFNLIEKGIINIEKFYVEYQRINMALWEEYKLEKITKNTLNFRRFDESLQLYNIKDSALAKNMGEYYILASPLKTMLYPLTLETLQQLQQKYQMHIITNGFEEVQYIKIEKSGLGKYFDKIITSERAGSKKPHKGIFEFALKETNASVEESIIIGDDYEADILGGRSVGMDQIWVKHFPLDIIVEKPTFEVAKICDITTIL